MPVDVKDLPPAYQMQALRKLAEREKRRTSLPSPAADAPRKDSKYHNKPTERVTPAGKVLRFASQKEARRYDELMVLLQAGHIWDLRMQTEFTLQEAYTKATGERVQAIRYRADFTYLRKAQAGDCTTYSLNAKGEQQALVVEDVKSRPTRTKTYLMKRKMIKDRYGIDIQEV